MLDQIRHNFVLQFVICLKTFSYNNKNNNNNNSAKQAEVFSLPCRPFDSVCKPIWILGPKAHFFSVKGDKISHFRFWS